MAILPDNPSVQVTIRVDGADLQEHIDKELVDESGTITRYVEATTDTPFAIHIRVLPGTQMLGDCLAFDILADGHPIVTRLFCAEALTNSPQKVLIRDEVVQGILYPTKFSTLTTANSDDEDSHDDNVDKAKIQRLGNIDVIMSHARRTGQAGTSASLTSQNNFQQITSLPEKALKGQALSHTVTLGAPISVPHAQTLTAKSINPPGIHNGRYVFRYRSEKSLQAEMIIPRTPSPSATPAVQVKEEAHHLQ